MFKFFRREKKVDEDQQQNFEIELTAAVLAYEIARSDGEIDDNELKVLMKEIKTISQSWKF